MVKVPSILKRASTVSVGTAAGQLVAFGGSLILVRIYSPEAMGTFSTLVAASSILAPLASGRLEMAVPLPRSDRAARKLVFVGLILACLVSIAIVGALALFQDVLGFEVELISLWIWALPATIVSLVFYLFSNQVAVRFLRYGSLAVRGVLYPSIMVAFQVALGLIHFGASGLVLGLIAGHVATAVSLLLPMLPRMGTDSENDANWRDVARSFARYPTFLGPAGAVNALSTQLPQLGIALMYGMAVAGQFGMMAKILAVPIALIGQSIGYVYVGEIAKLRRAGVTDVRSLYDRLSLQLTLLGVLMLAVVLLAGEPAFSWLLGQEWAQAGTFAQLFVLSTVCQLIVVPLSQTLIVAGKTSTQLFVDLLRSAALGAALMLSGWTNASVEWSVFFLALVSATTYAGVWSINRHAAGRL